MMRKFLTYLIAALICCPAFAQREALENLLIDAVAQYDAGNIDDARKLLTLVAQADSTNDAAVYYLGMCDYRQNDLKSAFARLKKAYEMDSTNIWYVSSMASMLIEGGNNRAAAPLLKKLIAKRPASYRSPYNLTLIGDYEFSNYRDTLAMEYYEKALDIEPGYAPAELGRADVYRLRGNMPAYYLSIGRIIENPGVHSGIKSQILTMMLDNIDPRTYWVWGEQLGKLIDSCVEMHPEDVQSHVLKMRMFLIKGDKQAAILECNSIAEAAIAAKDKAGLLSALSTKGDLYHELGDKKACYKVYEQVLEIDPGYVTVLNNYAYFLCTEGKKLRKALEMSAKTIEAEPDNATYLDTYAWILHLLKRDKEAKPHFKHAMLYGGRDSKVILEHYSVVLRALGENERADYYKSLSEKK